MLEAIKYQDLKGRRLLAGKKSLREYSIFSNLYRISQLGISKTLWDYYLSIFDYMEYGRKA